MAGREERTVEVKDKWCIERLEVKEEPTASNVCSMKQTLPFSY